MEIPKKKVLVIGSGAAGTAAAWSLSRFPEKFSVQVWEKSAVPGGVALTSELNLASGKTVFINEGVQGGAPSYRNLLLLHTRCLDWKPISSEARRKIEEGLVAPDVAVVDEIVNAIEESSRSNALKNSSSKPVASSESSSHKNEEEENEGEKGEFDHLKPSPVHMGISFGKGEGSHWSNIGAPSELVEKMGPEIKRFGELLKKVHSWEPLTAFVPITSLLSWFGFSKDFTERMALPLVALFFGTGNQTQHVPAAVVARVFMDLELRLFHYDDQRLLSQTADMFAFAPLQLLYQTLSNRIASGHADPSTSTPSSSSSSSSSGDQKEGNVKYFWEREVVSVKYDSRADKNLVVDGKGQEEEFDEVIFACDAISAEKMLRPNTDWTSSYSRWVLRRVSYFHDITITHSDSAYMARQYHSDHQREEGDGVHYLVRTDPKDAKLIEMSFNLHQYQPQFRNKKTGEVEVEVEEPIFQTIFLDSNTSDRWTINDIDEAKIHRKQWWVQFAHTWKHFAFFVPFERTMQGRHHWWFAGSWTLFNTHEIATISGLAAAHRLGAPYPFSHDPLASKQFAMYLNVVHGL